MRLCLPADPAQDEVNRRHQLHFHCIRIQGILARRQRGMPHTALTRFDLFAVTKGVAGGIVARAAVVGDDHPTYPIGISVLALISTAPNQRLMKKVPSVSTC